MAPFTASRYVIPSVFLCSEKKLCIWDILRFHTEMEQVVRTHRTSRRSGLPRGVGELNPRPHSWIFTFVSVDSSLRSYLYTSGTVHTCTVRFIPVHTVLTKVRPRTYPISDAPFSRSARHLIIGVLFSLEFLFFYTLRNIRLHSSYSSHTRITVNWR